MIIPTLTAVKTHVPFRRKGSTSCSRHHSSSGQHKVDLEGVIHRLHFRFTASFLFVSAIVVSCIEWSGNTSQKIACSLSGPEDNWPVSQSVINTYCYVMSTFTLMTTASANPSQTNGSSSFTGLSRRFPDSTILNELGPLRAGTVDSISYKSYYLWVPFVFFLQGLTFYVPHMLFKSAEGGTVSRILTSVANLKGDDHDNILESQTQGLAMSCDVLARYFLSTLNFHNKWALKLVLIDVLYATVVILNIIGMDMFLGQRLSMYTKNVLESNGRFDDSEANSIFPKVAKCSFFNYGPSGTIQTLDAFCVLPINVINEKIFAFQWVWLVFVLSPISIISATCQILFMVCKCSNFRRWRMRYFYSMNLVEKNDHFEHEHEQQTNKFESNKMLLYTFCNDNFQYGDWKLFNLLALNLDNYFFGRFLISLATLLEERRLSNNNSDRSYA